MKAIPLLLLLFIVCAISHRDASGQLHNVTQDSLSLSSEDSIIGDAGLRAKPTAVDLSLQFIAGEVAFNPTFYSLWGNRLLTGNGNLGAIGLLVSTFTTPLLIHFTTGELNLKQGSLPISIISAIVGVYGVSIFALDNRVFGPNPTYLIKYFTLSLPMIAFAIVGYDLPLWVH
jgi:hypothetical protein